MTHTVSFTLASASCKRKPEQSTYKYASASYIAKKIAKDLFKHNKSNKTISLVIRASNGKQYGYVAKKDGSKISVLSHKHMQGGVGPRRSFNPSTQNMEYKLVDWLNEKTILDQLDWSTVCSLRESIDYLSAHPERIDTEGLARNPDSRAFKLLETYTQEFKPETIALWKDQYGFKFIEQMIYCLSVSQSAESMKVLHKIIIDNMYGLEQNQLDKLITIVSKTHPAPSGANNLKIDFLLELYEVYYDKIKKNKKVLVGDLFSKLNSSSNANIKKLFQFFIDKGHPTIYDSILENKYMANYIIEHWDDILEYYGGDKSKLISLLAQNENDKVVDLLLAQNFDFVTHKTGYWYLLLNKNAKALSILMKDLDERRITWASLFANRHLQIYPKINLEYYQKFLNKFADENDFMSDITPANAPPFNEENQQFKAYVQTAEAYIYERVLEDVDFLETKVRDFPLFFDHLGHYAREHSDKALYEIMTKEFWATVTKDPRNNALKIISKYFSAIKTFWGLCGNTNKNVMSIIRQHFESINVADLSRNANIFIRSSSQRSRPYHQEYQSLVDTQRYVPNNMLNFIREVEYAPAFSDYYKMAKKTYKRADTSRAIVPEKAFVHRATPEYASESRQSSPHSSTRKTKSAPNLYSSSKVASKKVKSAPTA